MSDKRNDTACPRCGAPRLHKMGWACGTSGTPDNYGSTPACQIIARQRPVVEAAEAMRSGIRYGLPAELGQLAIIAALDEMHAGANRGE